MASWKRLLVPVSEDVCAEYWDMRTVELIGSFLYQIRAALTATAALVAVGVGDPSASAAYGVLVGQLAGACSSAIGLSLSSYLRTSKLAAHARPLLAACTVVRVMCLACVPLVLRRCPQWFFQLTLLEAVVSASLTVVETPTNAALFTHVVRARDTRKRAEAARQTANQGRAQQLLGLLVRFLLVRHLSSDARIEGPWLLFSLGYLSLRLYRVLVVMAPPVVSRVGWQVVAERWDKRGRNGDYSPRALARGELRVIWGQWICGSKTTVLWKVRLGVGLPDLLDVHGTHSQHAGQPKPEHVAALLKSHSTDAYVLGVSLGGSTGAEPEFRCVLKQDAEGSDHLKALLHALRAQQEIERVSLKHQSSDNHSSVTLSQALRALAVARTEVAGEWNDFCKSLESCGCDLNGALLDADSWRLQRASGSGNKTLRVTERYPKGGGDFLTRAWRLSDSPALWTPDDEAPRTVPADCPGSVRAWLRNALLPAGYPNSVAAEYMEYQLWDTLQVLCNDLRTVVTSQAALVGAGVGSASASALVVVQTDLAVAFVGQVLALVCGARSSEGSVNNMKQWRLLNSVVHSVLAAIDACQVLLPTQRLWFRLSNSLISSALVPLGSGAETAVVLHLSKHSLNSLFRADVAAKEGNQDRILGLLLLTFRIALLWWMGLELARMAFAMVVLTGGHIIFNYWSARVLVLNSLNAERLNIVLQDWTRTGTIPSPHAVSQREHVARPRAAIGTLRVGTTTPPPKELVHFLRADNYIIGPSALFRGGSTKVPLVYSLKEGAPEVCVLRAALHGWLFQRVHNRQAATEDSILRSLHESASECQSQWPQFCQALKAAGWHLGSVLVPRGQPWHAHTE